MRNRTRSLTEMRHIGFLASSDQTLSAAQNVIVKGPQSRLGVGETTRWKATLMRTEEEEEEEEDSKWLR